MMTNKEAMKVLSYHEGDVCRLYTLRWLMDRFEIQPIEGQPYYFKTNIFNTLCSVYVHGYGRNLEQMQELMDKPFRVNNLDINCLDLHLEDDIDFYKRNGIAYKIIGR